MVVSRLPAVLLLLALAGWGLAGCKQSAATGPAEVRVVVGPQDMSVRPSQYCLDGERQRYTNRPPILEVSPDSPITLSVPESVADHGWSVQVFDEKLEKTLGEVRVPKGTTVLDEINTADVVPPTFYLVVVEDKGGDCGEFTGAWPIGFIRAGG
ncbi:MAG: uncharacterized protein JWQ99_183 [Blastococcus sp.]|nr:uncharacterized protein [Blastococcus sp.]